MSQVVVVRASYSALKAIAEIKRLAVDAQQDAARYAADEWEELVALLSVALPLVQAVPIGVWTARPSEPQVLFPPTLRVVSGY